MNPDKAPDKTMSVRSRAMREALVPHGLIVRGTFRSTAADLAGTNLQAGSVSRLVLIGNAGAAMWRAFAPFIDGDPPTLPAGEAMTDEDAVVHAVRERLDTGAEAIKLYSTLPPEKVRQAISEVAGQVPVTGHLATTRASEAMKAGINGLEHALATPYNDFVPEELRTPPGQSWMAPGFWGKLQQGWLEADLTSDASRSWIELLVDKDVSFCPTLTLSPGAEDRTEEERPFVRFPQGGSLSGRRRSYQVSPEARQLGQDARRKLQDLVGLVHQAGGRVIAGTDTGPMQPPGFALHRELGHLSGAGLSNMDVIRASTARAAEALWREDLGTIVPGKRADFLLLRNDPLKDIAALRDIQHVVRDGKVYDPEDLLEEAQAAK